MQSREPDAQRPPIARETIQAGARECTARVWKKRDGYEMEVFLSVTDGPGQPLIPSLMIFAYSCSNVEELEQKLWQHAPRTGPDSAIVWKAISKVLRHGMKRRPVAAWPFPT